MRKMQSIRFKITAIAIAAILTAIFSIIAASYSTIQSETDRQSVEIMKLIRDDTKNMLDEYFAGIEQSVGMAANMAVDSLDSVVLVECGAAGTSFIDISERTPEQTARLDAYIAEHCEQVQKTFASVGTHTNGVISYYYCINPEISRSEHGFFYSRIGKAGFVRQTPLDAGTLDPEDQEHTTWYFTPIRRGRPSWVGPYTDSYMDDMWTCSYLVPIYSTGSLIGVLGMDIPLETLVNQVKSIRVYETGFASLCDEQLRIVYHPDQVLGVVPELEDLTVARGLFNQDDSGDALIRYKVDSERRQISYATLRNGMKLVISAPVHEINSSWRRLVRIVVLITAVVIVVFSVILLFAMRLITGPLLRLTAASRKLADADYSARLDYQGSDEIGMLTNSFIKMRDRLKDYIEDLNRRVNTDMLTGLPNMRYFFRLATGERARILEEGKHPVILFFDLIGMKHYNRQYGFDEGDRLLRDVGRILARHYGERCICRFSGDHFVALSEEEGLEEKLQALFAECESANGGKPLPVRAGIYQNSLEEVDVSVACDRAKYACDRHRGSYVSEYFYFDNDMLSQLDGVRYIVNHLNQALSEHWIEVYYQPIIRTINGHVCDEEALARWIDPVRGMLSPGIFIPILEKARLIYKLDLYVLDQILEKMRAQKQAGLLIVPHSLNLSRSDFDSCDIVEEICRRVDAAGIPRDRLTIEVTESMIGSDFDFMKEQIRRFQTLGFRVWMDDFGSGYSSLDILQDIHFDLLKFDMRFMKRFDEGTESKIILTDLIRMAIDLGIDTICEGVETAEEVEFLREVGCSKLQGFYYCRPVPYEEIVERYRRGIQIGFENPAETDYFASLGRVNLNDLAVIANKESEHEDYFDMLPVGIMEVQGDQISFIRTNPAYRDFISKYFGFDLTEKRSGYAADPEEMDGSYMRAVRQCCAEGTRAFYDGILPNGSGAHISINPVGSNPVNGAMAVTVAVLSISEPDKSTTYADIARALAADYYNIYVVDLDTDDFIEYSSRTGGEELVVERHGTDFFEQAKRDTMIRVYEEDREPFLAWFTLENIVRELDRQGVFTATYRLIDTGYPMYVSMKITRMPGGNRIIIGISIIDAQMKLKEHEEELQRERDTMIRVMALTDGYLSLCTVDPDTGKYYEIDAADDPGRLEETKEGDDFFMESLLDAKRLVYPEDQAAFTEQFTKEEILREIRQHGSFKLQYRLMIHDEPRPVTLKIALFKEGEEERLVVGVRAWSRRH